jgi:toxin CptA
MRLPLRLQLKPSRCYFLFLASGHILAGVAVCLLPLPMLVRASAVLLLPMLMLCYWRGRSGWMPSLLLRSDGKLELEQRGESVLAEVGTSTVVWPGLIVLHLQVEEGRQKPLVLFPDGLAGIDDHRNLRVWLRWRAELQKP